MRFFFLLFSFLFFINGTGLLAQPTSRDSVKAALKYYIGRMATGNYLTLEDTLKAFLRPDIPVTPNERVTINVCLGIISSSLCQYEKAIQFYKKAENIYISEQIENKATLVNLYLNTGSALNRQGDFNRALDYDYRALNIELYENFTSDVLYRNNCIFNTYLNIGSIFYDQKKYSEAMEMFLKCLEIIGQHNLPDRGTIYFRIAMTFEKKGDKIQAKENYELTIGNLIKDYGERSHLLGEVYRYYGRLLLSLNEVEKGLLYYEKAIQNFKANTGEKGSLISSTYLLQGNYYKSIGDYPGAFYYYQKSLIAISPDFNNPDIFTNPDISNSLLDYSLLYALQRKSEAFSQYASTTNDKIMKGFRLEMGLKTIDPALELINKMLINYQDAESRLFFTSEQKYIFITAIENALALNELKKEERYLEQAYRYARESKANELRYEIARNNALSEKDIPDSLKIKEKKLQSEIADCEFFIQTMQSNTNPDIVKINGVKDRLFGLNRELEKVVKKIQEESPVFKDRLKTNKTESLREVQHRLGAGESLVEYVLSGKDEQGACKLFTFVVNKNNLYCHYSKIDSTALAGMDFIQHELSKTANQENGLLGFNRFGSALYKAYNILIQPVEKYFSGKKLIIVPDEKISYLPFDSFLTSFEESKQVNYTMLSYLINDYTISYAYFSNTRLKNTSYSWQKPVVSTFSPDYQVIGNSGGNNYRQLKEAGLEVQNILKWFDGKTYTGEDATRTNFKLARDKNNILHFAMHAEMDPQNAGLSHLVFSPDRDTLEGSKLFNYEIGQMQINSPLVVLSACDTGNGRLYSGEGVISLARNFILAGVPSVVETLWPVEDVAGSKIMENFYKYLSDGMAKDEALRMAKLDYINNISPSFANPHFWASYALLGDNSALINHWWQQRWFFWPAAGFVLILVVFLLYHSRFFKIIVAFFR
jgi:CHAT domain-containing protein/tetratricopeptide (TPR) repeat protein